MKKIIVVEDDYLVRVGICSMCDWESHGYVLAGSAENGNEAIKLIETIAPDIVLTDLVMNGLDGFGLIAECRKRWPHILLIVLSNYDDIANVKKAIKLGAIDYIPKISIDPDNLLKILDQALVSHNLPASPGISDSNLSLVRFQLLRRLRKEKEDISSDLETQCKAAGLILDFDDSPMYIIDFRFAEVAASIKDFITLGTIIDEAIPKKYKTILCLDGERSALAIVCGGNIIDEADDIFSRVKLNCRTCLGKGVRASISEEIYSLQDLDEAINKANAVLMFNEMSYCELIKPQNSKRIGIRKVIKYISENFDKPITLKSLADIAAMSECYFSHIFKIEQGVGVKEYITLLRLEKAKKLLCESNYKISTVASECGFLNSNYFNSVFRKMTGITPNEYRNLHKCI